MTSPVTLVSVAAAAENALLVTFNEGIYFSQLLDTPDASLASLWSVTPVAGTVGYDGSAARPVSVTTVTAATLDGSGNPTSVTVTLDRPMTPYPAQYVLTVSSVWSADLTQRLQNAVSSAFLAVYRQLDVPQVQVAAQGRDFANPQTLSGALGSTVSQPYQQLLGTLGYSDDHDYAIDKGDPGLLKRLTRRTFTKKNGFVFLPGYGAGITTYGKRLGKASVRDQLSAELEAQYAQEPEVAKVVITMAPDKARPELTRLGAFLQKKSGKTARYTTLIPAQ